MHNWIASRLSIDNEAKADAFASISSSSAADRGKQALSYGTHSTRNVQVVSRESRVASYSSRCVFPEGQSPFKFSKTRRKPSRTRW